MESLDRIRAALALEKPDRPPFTWWGHTFREEWAPDTLAAVTVERARTHAWDFVKLQPRASSFAEAFGSEYRPSGNAEEAPVLVRAGVQGLEDWARLPEVAGGLSMALAESFSIVDPDVANPQTWQWERVFRLFSLLL